MATLLRFVAIRDVDVVMFARRWTLLDRSGVPLLAECARRGVSVVAATPFNSGILATNHPSRDQHLNHKKVTPGQLATATALAQLFSRHGVDLPHAALRFPLRHHAVAAVVPGARSGSEARLATLWMDRAIPEDLWRELDAFDFRATTTS